MIHDETLADRASSTAFSFSRVVLARLARHDRGMATQQEKADARQVAAMLEEPREPRWQIRPSGPDARFLGRKGAYDLWYLGTGPAPGDTYGRPRVPIFEAITQSGNMYAAWSRGARDKLKRANGMSGSLMRYLLSPLLGGGFRSRAPWIAALEEARRRYFASK